MTWPRALLPVPVHHLTLDPQTSGGAGKATPAEMQRWMGRVDEIYRLRAAGATDADFHRMATVSTTFEEQELGRTYQHLFSTSPSASPLKAEYQRDGSLVVTSGQHRIMAAQATGVAVVPVHVSAPDQSTLEAIREQCEREASQLRPELDIVTTTREHDAQVHPDRAQIRTPLERHIGPERLEPERENGWRYPERER